MALPPDAIANTFAFDQLHPVKSKCAKVRGALLRKLQRAQCGSTPGVGTASGRPAIGECALGEKARYVLFSKLEDCKEERLTQLANGA